MKKLPLLVTGIVLAGAATAAVVTSGNELSSDTYSVSSNQTSVYPPNLLFNVLGIPVSVVNPGVLYQTVAYCNAGDKVISGGYVGIGTDILGSFKTYDSSTNREGWLLMTTPLSALPNLTPPPLLTPNTAVVANCAPVEAAP